MPKISVICCIYNSFPVVRRCLEAFMSCTPRENVEIILVDNCGPDPDSSKYAMELCRENSKTKFVRLVKTEKNLGCHGGWNFGYRYAHGDYVCKLDDDSVILTPEWPGKMTAALDAVPKLGYLSADIDAKQNNKYLMEKHAGFELEVAYTGVVGFSLVMFRRDDIVRWGPMKTGVYRAAGGKAVNEDRLYGGEEVYYASAARQEGKIIAHYPAVQVHHLDNEERHPDYALWKRVYGYHAWTNKPMPEWIAAGEHIYHYAVCITNELNSQNPNDALLRDWVKRLGEIGEPKHIQLIEQVPSKTKNGVVIETVGNAVRSIMERVK